MEIQDLQAWFNSISFQELWFLQAAAILVVTSILSVISKGFFTRAHNKLANTKNIWDDVLVLALSRPVSLLIWLIGLSLAIELVEANVKGIQIELAGYIREVGLILLIGWFFIRFIKEAEGHMIEGRNGTTIKAQDKMTVEAVARLLRISVIIIVALMILQNLGYSISGVLAFGGIGGLAVGLAAKDILANFFGAIMIYLDRPFAIGDWIRSPDKDIEGTVEAIGWRVTRIRTFDARPLYLPNSIFTSIIVQNPSRMTNRRIYETIGVRYDDYDKVNLIVSDVKAMLKAHEAIDQTKTLMVNFNCYASCSLDFFIYAFTKTIVWQEYHEIKQDVLLKVGDIIASHGAQIAFPTKTVHLPDVNTIKLLNAKDTVTPHESPAP